MPDLEKCVGADFRGCVLVSENGKTVFSGAYGCADLPNGVPNRMDTRFATASAGKVFVAVCILKLIEAGRLRLTDTLGALMDFDLNAIDPAVTVGELLCHRAGVPDYFDEAVMDEYEELWVDFPCYKIRRNRDLLPLFIDKPMQYPRGTEFRYNNTGFVLLAMVIERVTGLPFDEYIDEVVFRPCGMADTGYFELDRLPARCANNYIWDESRGEYKTSIYSVDAKGTGAGGAYTTLADIQRFWECLTGGKLLQMETVETMFENHSGEDECYGYGVWLEKRGDGFSPYIQGCDPGVSFIASWDLSKKRLITAVSNFGDDVWALAEKIADSFR